MPFVRPSISTLISRVSDDLNAWLPNEDSRIRRSTLSVLARVLSAASHSLYGFIDWVSKQAIPDTAESGYLHRWAALFGVTPIAGIKATSTAVQFEGTNGIIVPMATTFQRVDGVQYITDAAGTISGGNVQIACTAVLDGDAGNAVSSTLFELVTPIAGINSAIANPVAFTGGTEDESDPALLARLLAQLRNPPQGGAETDYKQWIAEALPDLTQNVWPQYHSANATVPEGAVNVYFSLVWDGATPASVIPSGAQVTTAQTYLAARIPVTVDVLTVAAPTAAPINMTIELTTDTTAARAAVTAQVNDMFQRLAAPGGASIENSEVRAAIARGDEKFDLTNLNADGTGNSDLAQGATSLMHLGAITWA